WLTAVSELTPGWAPARWLANSDTNTSVNHTWKFVITPRGMPLFLIKQCLEDPIHAHDEAARSQELGQRQFLKRVLEPQRHDHGRRFIHQFQLGQTLLHVEVIGYAHFVLRLADGFREVGLQLLAVLGHQVTWIVE